MNLYLIAFLRPSKVEKKEEAVKVMAKKIESENRELDPKVVETGEDERIAERLQKQREEKRLL